MLLPLIALVASVFAPGIPSASAALGKVRVSVGGASVVEGDGGTRRVYFTVTLSRARSADTSVGFKTTSGTAVAGTDFVASSTTITIPAGATSVAVPVSITGNTAINAPTRSFGVKLSAPAGAWLGRSTATGTIIDDDVAPTPRVSISSGTVVAGSAATRVQLGVTLSKRRTTAVSVAFATRAGSATDGTDYTGASGRVTIPAGSTTAPIDVSIRPNGGTGGNAAAAFTVRLTGPVGATVDRGTGTVTIRRDGYATSAAWTQHGANPGLTGNAATETALSAATVSTVHQLWSVPLPFGTEDGVEPVSDGNAVFIVRADDAPPPTPVYGHLTAYDVGNGHELWSVNAADDDRQQDLAVGDGLVIAAGRCGAAHCLHAYRAADGTLAWTYNHAAVPFVAPMTIANGLIYAEDTFGQIEIDLATGTVTTGSADDWDYQSAVAGGFLVRADWVYDLAGHHKLWYSPYPQARATDGGSVFANEGTHFVARNVATGAQQWSEPVDCDGSAPAVSASAVVIQGCHVARAFDRQTGAELWPQYMMPSTSSDRPTIANGLAIINDESGFVTVLDLSNGHLAKQIDASTVAPVSSPVVVDGSIIVAGYSLTSYGN